MTVEDSCKKGTFYTAKSLLNPCPLAHIVILHPNVHDRHENIQRGIHCLSAFSCGRLEQGVEHLNNDLLVDREPVDDVH